MPTAQVRDASYMRGFFRAYAVVAAAAALVTLVGQDLQWFGTELVARVFRCILTVLTCWALAPSRIEDPGVRRTGTICFAFAHFAILDFLHDERRFIWGPGNAQTSGDILLVGWCVVMLMMTEFWLLTSRPLSRWGSWLGNARGEPQRSRNEQQMRAAGAQEERNRLARDLHDSIKQQIFVIQTAAATAQARFDSDHTGAATAIEQIRDSARDAMTEMEVMMDQLRSVPLENASLVEALKKLCEALGHRTGARLDFRLGDLPPNETLAPGSHQAILRVAQEALANIGRHARATNVTVSLNSLRDRVELRIQDDGAGFDLSHDESGMGIKNMRARAEEFGGHFEVASSPGNGTAVTFSIPRAEVPAESANAVYVWGASFGVLLESIFVYN
jgi:signal transduction histidine kinase